MTKITAGGWRGRRAPRDTRGGRRTSALPVLLGLTAAALLVGCAGGSSDGPGTGGASGAGAGGAGGGSGGAAGTSGTGGTGGSAPGGAGGASGGGGAAGTGGAGGASVAGACPAGAIFCADFEDGSIPSQATFATNNYPPTVGNYFTVDGTMAHRGTHALKVTPTAQTQTLAVTTGVATFWTRVYLRSLDVDTSAVTGHDTFVFATDANGVNNVRVGEHSCQLELNSAPTNGAETELVSSGAYMCSGGVAFARNTWYCLEVFYDGPNGEVRVFVDGTEVGPLHATGWGPFAYTAFKFGFESYGGTARTLWYDDVAVATQRIGCYP
jgi:hypothetical protein